jgi:hypothetical protein
MAIIFKPITKILLSVRHRNILWWQWEYSISISVTLLCSYKHLLSSTCIYLQHQLLVLIQTDNGSCPCVGGSFTALWNVAQLKQIPKLLNAEVRGSLTWNKLQCSVLCSNCFAAMERTMAHTEQGLGARWTQLLAWTFWGDYCPTIK